MPWSEKLGIGIYQIIWYWQKSFFRGVNNVLCFVRKQFCLLLSLIVPIYCTLSSEEKFKTLIFYFCFEWCMIKDNAWLQRWLKQVIYKLSRSNMKITYVIQLKHILFNTRKKLGVEWKRLDILKALILALVTQIIFCLSFITYGPGLEIIKVFSYSCSKLYSVLRKNFLSTFPAKWDLEYRLHYNAYNVC